MNGNMSVIDATPEFDRNRWAVTRPFKFEEPRDSIELLKSRTRPRWAHCIKDETQGVEISITADDVVDKENALAHTFMEVGMLAGCMCSANMIISVHVLSQAPHQAASKPRVLSL